MTQSPFNRDPFEMQLLSASLLAPTLTELIQPEVFVRESNQQMYKAIVECAKAGGYAPIHLSNLYASAGKGFTDYDVNNLNHWIERTGMKADDATSVVNTALEKIKDFDKGDAALTMLWKAQGHIIDGNYSLGVAAAHTVKFPTTDVTPLTIMEMTASLGSMSGFRTGIGAIDKNIFGFPKGNLISVCGDTGSQKTMATIHLCLSILEANPTFQCVYFEKEMPKEDVYRRLVSRYFKLKNEDIMRLSEATLYEERKSTEELMFERYASEPELRKLLDRFHVMGPEDFYTPADMYKIISDYKANIWCLDYITMLDGTTANSGDKAYTVMENIKQLKNIVHSTGSTGIVISQLNKGTVERRAIKIPTMDDIEWSSDIKKLSSYVFATFCPSNYHRGYDKRQYYLVCLKSRYSQPFNIPLLADPAYCSFTEPNAKDTNDMARSLQEYLQKDL